jgi:diaminohydroxyphosphoribosylaminopyrimidine deaminase/5-amino-6-(5-phosphoribosylamino)uracil reductase
MAGFFTRLTLGRPHVTLKLALSLDGCIALPSGASKWITGAPARAHTHLERARHDAILVGRGTYDADRPGLDVRLPGLEQRAPRRLLLSKGPDAPHWERIDSLDALAALERVDHVLVEGGAATATAFLRADLVDRLLLYRAPILLGGKPALGNLGLHDLEEAHGRWARIDSRRLGSDTLEVYERA